MEVVTIKQKILLPNIKITSEYSIHRKQEKIQSVAFNIGFKKSTAPYIIRLDAHAEYDSQYIALCLENLKKIALGAM